MSDFEEMYKKFNLDENQVNHLNKLASRQYPLDVNGVPVSVETIIIDGAKELKSEEGVIDAKLV